MAWYIFYNIKKLLLYEDDKQFNEYGLEDLDEMGVVNYNQTDQFIFFTLQKQVNGMYLSNEVQLTPKLF